MTTKHGRLAEIWCAGLNLTPYSNSLDTSWDIDTAEKSVFQTLYKSYEPGQAAASVSIKGNYDPTQTTVPAQIAASAGPIMTAGPAGMTTAGDLCRLFDVDHTSYKESSPIGGIVAFELSCGSDGAVGFGVVSHPLAAETTDGNGTSVDGGAASTTGAIVHVHVTAMTGGDTLDFKLQDSANNSTWADVASGAVPTISAVGGYRLVIAGTIRQYTRIVWDIDANSVTFGAAVART
jgi:hypothetical protein